MSKLKAMKFKVNSPEHSKEIQEKLFEMGYEWCNGKKPLFTDSPALYAGYFEDNSITHSYEVGEDFDDVGDYNCTEHFLIEDAQGKRFVTKDYWTQPVTKTKPPLGIVPRNIFLHQRNIEILKAAQRCLEANCLIPNEWLYELQNNLEEIKNAKV